ncbi:hypothetical protein BDA99DRAFT_516525 [Phascolomyces articulosus]|uniref:Glycosyltransferase family 49 protein n=1 Tax=Phascolomyces articulosus TaxID=60185 RepID=A0AAD5JVF8_9FUNG|nr:hypothetical protein BDA99DRAFT_516525 [Phascolomyces articulosus]
MAPPRSSESGATTVASRSTKPGFHQRKPSLTSACPPTGARSMDKSRNAFPPSSLTQYCKRLYRLRIVRLLGWTYVLTSLVLSTMHLFSSLTSSHSSKSLGSATALVQDMNHIQKQQQFNLPDGLSPLNTLTYQLRLSKMFSKSLIRMDHLRPYWFTATASPTSDQITIATILTMDEWPHLVRLAEIWQGPISATVQIPSDMGGLASGAILQHLSSIRREYETQPMLARHVDLHLIVRPSNGDPVVHGGFQDSRNLARLFSRTDIVAHVPVTILWVSDLTTAAKTYRDRLLDGDVLIVPTFGFPNSKNAITDEWPTTKSDMVEWADEKRIGLLDYHWRLSEGPTSYPTWREATEPYLVPEYDYHYTPIYISTRDDHPWCEERFADEPSSCLYSIYLNGANLWVLPNDYVVRTGKEAEKKLTSEESKLQVPMYKNYRIEQCVFYARQFDQAGIFDTDRAKHVQQECAKALGSLRKEKIISPKPIN